jgi:ABC-type amino acid transport substrate-binding protein
LSISPIITKTLKKPFSVNFNQAKHNDKMMNLKRKFLGVVVLGLMLIQAHTHAAELNDITSIQKSGVLRVGVIKNDLPGFKWKVLKDETITNPDGTTKTVQTEEFQGPEIDLVNNIASKIGITTSINDEAKNQEELITMLAKGKIDVAVSKIQQTYPRWVNVRFSRPYIKIPYAALYNRLDIEAGADNTKKLSEEFLKFKGKVGVIKGTAYEPAAKNHFKNSEVIAYDNWKSAVAALKSGKVSLLYRDEFEIKALLKADPQLNIKFGVASIKDRTSNISVAICDSCGKLQQFVNYYLDTEKNDFSIVNSLKLLEAKK